MPTAKRPKRPVSAKQQAANELNAGNSTGPSAAGKKRSSRNAVKNGVWAQVVEPIHAGPFKEDADEFRTQVEEIVTGLAPRDAIEQSVAGQIAGALIRHARTERLEAAMLLAAVQVMVLDQPPGTVPEHMRLEDQLMEVEILLAHFDGSVEVDPQDDDAPSWAEIARLIRSHSPDPTAPIDDIWTEGLTPETEEAWEAAVSAIVARFWPDVAACEEDLRIERARLQVRLDAALIQHRAAAARSQIAITMSLDRPRTAATKELGRFLDVYDRLRRRPLVDPE